MPEFMPIWNVLGMTSGRRQEYLSAVIEEKRAQYVERDSRKTQAFLISEELLKEPGTCIQAL